jgi:UDP-N-acetyl-D-mannosaminuronic acid transferase (WecB/TagA/CpsF family)
MRTTESPQFRSILGIRFFVGDATQAVQRMNDGGGLLVVPAAPALKNLPHDPAYRKALLEADLVITDSAFMVLIWNYLQHDSIRRVSGLEYLSALLKQPSFLESKESFWIMANQESAEKNCIWLQEQGINLTSNDFYVAPLYGKKAMYDPVLLECLNQRRPKHVIVTIGGGTQERLGLYLRQELAYSPSIHCVGAAIAFLSGDQVHIPAWADRMYLGWLLRCLSDPKEYLPRYWDARKLFALMLRHGSSLPGSA